MDISSLFWRFIHVVSTRPLEQCVSSRSFMKIMTLVKRKSKVFLHTSYLPYLPYEANTYVLFDNVDTAFETIHEMYVTYAAETAEAEKIAQALSIIQHICQSQSHSLSNVAFLTELFQGVRVS